MKKLLLILLCFQLIGCATLSNAKKVRELQKSLNQKTDEVKTLQGLLDKKEQALKEKDTKIEELRQKLKMFGVFE